MTALRAEIIGSNQATAAGIVVSGRNAPVTALCRALIEAGHDPAMALEAYRGASLRIRSIGEGAALSVSEATSDGKARFVPFRPLQDRAPNVGGRPPLRQTAEGVGEVPLNTGKPFSDGDPHIAAIATSAEAA
jgi:hypothetical protein